MSSDSKPRSGGFNLGQVEVQKAVDASDGEWIQLVHPVDGHLLFVEGDADEWGKVPDEDDPGEAKPCRVKIISTQTARYRKEEFRIHREAAARKRKVGFEDANETALKRAAAMIVGMENIPDSTGRMLDAKNEADKMILLRTAQAFADQIIIAAQDASNFFEAGSSGPSPQGSAKAG